MHLPGDGIGGSLVIAGQHDQFQLLRLKLLNGAFRFGLYGVGYSHNSQDAIFCCNHHDGIAFGLEPGNKGGL